MGVEEKDRKLLTSIINELATGEKTTNEITESQKSNWITVQGYLESMVNSGLATKRHAGNRAYYCLKGNTKYRHDTYFGLPLEDEKVKLLRNIYAYITQNWEKEKGKRPTQMELHKISYDINKDRQLGIPFGWYIYGAIAVLATTGEILENVTLDQKVKECADKVIQKYIHNDYSWQTKMQQYRQEKKELYLKKEQILAKLYKKEFSQELYSDLDLLFIKASELTKNEQDYKFFNIYSLILEDTVKQRLKPIENNAEAYEVKDEIDYSFKQIWELIAMHNFKKELEEYYTHKILEEHFGPHINEQRKIIQALLDEMISKLKYDGPTDETYLKLKTITENIHEKAKENRLKEKKELTQEELFKAIGR